MASNSSTDSISKALEELKKSSGVHALAGSGGGVLAFLLTYPLITISTRLSVQVKEGDQRSYNGALDAVLKIWKQEGITGFYSGLHSGLFGVAVTQGVYYYFYRFWRTFFENRVADKQKIGDLTNLAIAALAGVVTALTTNPIWVINTRMMVSGKQRKPGEKSPTTKETLAQLLKEEGIGGLWNGIIPALILVSNPAVQYMVFEKIKKFVESRRTEKLKPFHNFLMGGLSKVVATFVTYPYIVVKSRLQMKQTDQQYVGATDALTKILQNEGFFGLYKGLSSKIVQSVLNSSFLFAFQEELVVMIAVLFLSLKKIARK